ncbi:MAG: citrate synthase [Bacteroidota bacterium]|nr:citrate synthase [Bacteroidota bacterium]
MKNRAELHYNGNIYVLPVISGSEEEQAIDISKLRSQSGLITLDRGYKNTGSTTSAITFLNGEEGVLSYRGYPIEELAEKSTFLEVAYLLIYGELPLKQELNEFIEAISSHTLVHEDVKSILHGFPSNSHPMGVLSSLVSSLTAFYPKSLDPNRSSEQINGTIIRAIAKLPTLAAWSYKNRMRQPIIYPKNELSYTENFVHMMFGMPTYNLDINPVISDALNKLLILHADHEQNCSTSTVRIVGSSHASLYTSISAGIAALWGPLHGGANQAVIEMLEMIKNDESNVAKYVLQAKDKSNNFRLMGFGHRVYKSFDPRAKIIKKTADTVLKKLGLQDPILDIAKELEELALKDQYFIDRDLYPNVDFYSGIIYRALGIPTNMFTVMFALGRLPGWIAQWKEMRENGDPIGRPRQIYTGKNRRSYVPIANR